jgi:hypothetical protein
MTIQELVEALSNFPPDTPVVVRGYEGGFNDIRDVVALDIQLNVNTIWYYGAHGPNTDISQPVPDIPFTNVVYLHSYNHITEEDWHDK